MDEATEMAYQDLRCLIDIALIHPFSEYRWHSRRARALWYESEGLLDAVAGPLSAIAERGDCEYVYNDNDRWPQVQDADDLEVWFLGWFSRIRSVVHDFIPGTPAERTDYAYMLENVRELRTAIDLAVVLERTRSRLPPRK